MNKIVGAMDFIRDITKPLRITFIIFTVIVVYVEFLYSKLDWATWIITPVFILIIVGWLWDFVRENWDKGKGDSV